MPETTILPDQALFTLAREILVRELAEPKSEAEVAKLLAISKPQAKAWLAILAQERTEIRGIDRCQLRSATNRDRPNHAVSQTA